MTKSYTLTFLAAEDLNDIAHYTLRKWGRKQSIKYKEGLKDMFNLLSQDVLLGKTSKLLGSNLRRFTYESHVIFYQPSNDGILIIRVLHSSRDFLRFLK